MARNTKSLGDFDVITGPPAPSRPIPPAALAQAKPQSPAPGKPEAPMPK